MLVFSNQYAQALSDKIHCDTSEILGTWDQTHLYEAVEIYCPQFYLFVCLIYSKIGISSDG